MLGGAFTMLYGLFKRVLAGKLVMAPKLISGRIIGSPHITTTE